jgi:hypothetical protein
MEEVALVLNQVAESVHVVVLGMNAPIAQSDLAGEALVANDLPLEGSLRLVEEGVVPQHLGPAVPKSAVVHLLLVGARDRVFLGIGAELAQEPPDRATLDRRLERGPGVLAPLMRGTEANADMERCRPRWQTMRRWR